MKRKEHKKGVLLLLGIYLIPHHVCRGAAHPGGVLGRVVFQADVGDALELDQALAVQALIAAAQQQTKYEISEVKKLISDQAQMLLSLQASLMTTSERHKVFEKKGELQGVDVLPDRCGLCYSSSSANKRDEEPLTALQRAAVTQIIHNTEVAVHVEQDFFDCLMEKFLTGLERLLQRDPLPEPAKGLRVDKQQVIARRIGQALLDDALLSYRVEVLVRREFVAHVMNDELRSVERDICHSMNLYLRRDAKTIAAEEYNSFLRSIREDVTLQQGDIVRKLEEKLGPHLKTEVVRELEGYLKSRLQHERVSTLKEVTGNVLATLRQRQTSRHQDSSSRRSVDMDVAAQVIPSETQGTLDPYAQKEMVRQVTHDVLQELAKHKGRGGRPARSALERLRNQR